MSPFKFRQQNQYETLTFAALVSYDPLAIEEPYRIYIPVIDYDERGATLHAAMAVARYALGMRLIEMAANNQYLPASETELPVGQPGEMATFIDVDLKKFRHYLAQKQTIIKSTNDLREPDRVFRQVADAQPVFVTEQGAGKYVILTLDDYDIYRNAVDALLGREEEIM